LPNNPENFPGQPGGWSQQPGMGSRTPIGGWWENNPNWQQPQPGMGSNGGGKGQTDHSNMVPTQIPNNTYGRLGQVGDPFQIISQAPPLPGSMSMPAPGSTSTIPPFQSDQQQNPADPLAKLNQTITDKNKPPSGTTPHPATPTQRQLPVNPESDHGFPTDMSQWFWDQSFQAYRYRGGPGWMLNVNGQVVRGGP